MGLSGWRRCAFICAIMDQVVGEKRYPEAKSDIDQLISAMKDDKVMD